MEIEADWLKDGINWEKEQNRDIKREQKAKSMPVDRKQAGQALVVGKRVGEQKKHQLPSILDKT